ncbi:related to MRPS28 - mitochondrial ribosomal protein, small subunit [Melanopsichium pennsylvanicum]|uniref:Related to MRPS28 - mitochondrial ribosomal protein, small subunit n=2 Tax=Melanopsichium pennsylvanicum TaxID=63383 RepID=A0AAJ4XQY0_9BASI|nr:related to MRPS28-mitochondrial ribosomal protein, small subunit [Melanopsichium pennsylvanicum 4]SNX86316.1 related to MRPS28 - mitochondrial ribosomal protein, small subunit [Melanopsichium pennsylvanicum]
MPGLTAASCCRCIPSTFSLSSLAASLPSTSYAISHRQTFVSFQSQQQRSSFSTSPLLSETRKKRTARLKRKSNLDQRTLKVRMLESSKPDVVLGHQLTPAGNKIWQDSELANIILTKQSVWGVKEDRQGNLVPIAANEAAASARNLFDSTASKQAKEFGGPARLNFGLDGHDRELLFQNLPQVMIKDRILDSWNLGTLIRGTANHADVSAFESEYAKVSSEEASNKEALGRILDLRNASGKGIQVENIRRIISHFGGEKRDTGSPEVQAAVLTYRIRNLHEHLEGKNRHDNSNRRSMSLLTHQRAKILKYLKTKSPHRYHDILKKIGLEARAVEGEIVVPGKPKITRA